MTATSTASPGPGASRRSPTTRRRSIPATASRFSGIPRRGRQRRPARRFRRGRLPGRARDGSEHERARRPRRHPPEAARPQAAVAHLLVVGGRVEQGVRRGQLRCRGLLVGLGLAQRQGVRPAGRVPDPEGRRHRLARRPVGRGRRAQPGRRAHVHRLHGEPRALCALGQRGRRARLGERRRG